MDQRASAEVKNCAVQECFYNIEEYCRAAAIMVGREHPSCDTFVVEGDLSTTSDKFGFVDTCEVVDCKYNHNRCCHAGSINVDYHDSHADCYTYDPLPKASEEVDAKLYEETQEVDETGSTAFRLNVEEPTNIVRQTERYKEA